MGWIVFFLYCIGIIAVPRLVLVFFFLQAGGWMGCALVALSAYQMGEDLSGLGSLMKNVRDGIRIFLTAVLIGMWRAWFNVFCLLVRGREFIVVEVVEVEKIVYRDRVKTVRQKIEIPVVREMTRADACEVIGCVSDADKTTIDRKYRSILQKVHPDHGGSVFLTTIVNQARAKLR